MPFDVKIEVLKSDDGYYLRLTGVSKEPMVAGPYANVAEAIAARARAVGVIKGAVADLGGLCVDASKVGQC